MSKKGNSSIIAIVAMIFLFGMISFVTNLAAPIGNIWKMQPGIEGSNFWGMMGNMMNFLAYAIMGIPARHCSWLRGCFRPVPFRYRRCRLHAGRPAFQFLRLSSGRLHRRLRHVHAQHRGEPHAQAHRWCLMGTLTPMLVGSLIGTLTKDSLIKDVNPVLFLAMGVFAFAFIVLMFVNIQDPEAVKDAEHAVSPLKFKHFVLGVIAIFVYVGVEVGIPGTLNFYLSDSVNGAGMDPSTAVAIAGFVAGTYWLLMLVGRLTSSVISGKVSARTQLTCVSAVALVLIVLAIILGNSSTVSMPVFKGGADGFGMVQVPIAALLLVLCGLCTSVMWGTIFDLACEGLGASTNQASGIFMAMVVGGGIVPLIQNAIADAIGYMPSYWLLVACVGFILYFAAVGSKVKKA